MTRTLRLVLVTMLVAAGLTLVPVPTMVWADGLETVTRSVGLSRATSVDARGLLRESPMADHAHDHHASDLPTAPSKFARQGGQQRVDPFTAIGVTLDSQPEGPVAFRIRENGSWSPWRELSFSEDHAPDGEEALRAPKSITSDPFVVDRATGYELQVPENVGDVKVHLVTITDRRVRLEVGENEAGAGTPAIHRRAEWGARPYRGTPDEAPKLSMAVVHHSAGATDQPTATILRSIQAYHMDGRGWSDIGYNFAVDPSGAVWEARQGGIDRAIIGAHATGFNARSTGVVILGDYDARAPTAASLIAVQQIISWKFALHHAVPSGKHVYRAGTDSKFGPAGTSVALDRVIGHRDVGITSCPGGNVYGRMATIRNGVVSASVADQPVVPARVMVGRWNRDSRDDLLMYRPGSAADTRYYGGRVSSGLLGLSSEPALNKASATINGLYEPIVGDFDGDGITDVMWYGAEGRPDYTWYGRDDGSFVSTSIVINGTYDPFVGDFDGDGLTDVYWYRGSAGSGYIWYGQANRSVLSRTLPATGGWTEPLVGDFDADGRSDIFFYGHGSTPDEVRYGAGRGAMVRKTITVNGYYRPIVGDFTGEGRDDIFWYKPGTGADYLWEGRAGRTFGSRDMTVAGVFDPLVGDFDGNGTDDVFWSRSEGPDYLWLFRSGDVVSRPRVAVSSRFNAQGTLLSGSYLTVLDADGDGKDELFAQEHPTGGRLWFWDAAGTLRSKAVR